MSFFEYWNQPTHEVNMDRNHQLNGMRTSGLLPTDADRHVVCEVACAQLGDHAAVKPGRETESCDKAELPSGCPDVCRKIKGGAFSA